MVEEEAGTAVPTVQIETSEVRVTHWAFPDKGDNTGWHRHAHDYIVVPLFDGALAIKDTDGGITEAPMKVGASYARPAGIEHDVINCNDHPVSFVEIELLKTSEKD